MRTTLRRAACTLLAPLLLSCGGCSMVSFGYNHADIALRHWVNDYTTFTPQQQAEIRRDIDDYLRWHRAHALPEYRAFLQRLYVLVDSDRPLGEADVTRLRAELGRLYQLTLTPLVRPAAHVLATLDDKQIAELRATFDKRNREMRKELLPDGARENLLARARAQLKLAENLVGSLSREQARQITELSLRVPFETEDYLRQREQRLSALLQLVQSRAGEKKIATFLGDWVNSPERPAPLREQKANGDYDRAMDEMVIRSYALLTETQKKHLLAKIADYIGAFHQLEQEPAPRGAPATR